MIASWLRRMLVMESVLYAGLIAWGLPATQPLGLWLIVGVPGAILGVRGLWLLAIHGLAGRYREPPPPEFAGMVASLVSYFDELRALLYFFVIVQPWPARFDPAPTPRAGPRVLLVHGFGCNGAVWWPLRRWLSARCEAEFHSLSLEPALADLDDLAASLSARLTALAQADPSRPIVLVGHSMGGILARRCVQTLADPSVVERVITLGSPHAGTALAKFHPAPNAVQMRPASDWLRRLADSGDPRPVLTLASHQDHVVVPQSNAVFARARQIWLGRTGHLAMLLDPGVRQLLLDELSASDNIQ